MKLFNKKNRKILIPVSALVLITLFIFLLPVVIKLQAQSWLRDHGLTNASIEKIEIDFSDGTFIINNASGYNSDNRGFSLSRLLVEINWSPLFSKQLVIERIETESFQIDIEQTADKGLRLAGLDFKNSQEKKTQTHEEKNEPTEWSVNLKKLTLSDIRACHHVPGVPADAPLTTTSIQQACLSLNSLSWLGKLGWSAPATDLPAAKGFQVSGTLNLQQVNLTNHDQSLTFTHWEKLNVNKLTINALETISAEEFSVSGVRLLQLAKTEKPDYLAQWKLLNISKPAITLSANKVSADKINIDDLQSNIIRNKKGIAGLPVADKTMPANTKEQNEKFNFAIKQMQLSGNSTIKFTDKLVEPHFSETFSAINFSISNIDSETPGTSSPVSVDMKVSDYGKVDIKGVLFPFANKLTLQLQHDVKDIDLANYNVYGKTFIGHQISSGQLDLRQKIKVKNGYLDTESVFVLNKFRVKSLEGEEAEKYKSDLGIPLSTALSLLRDSNDNIELTIPVKGNLSSPDFSLGDVVSTVTTKIIKEAIINYYTPFGLVKLLGGIVDLATGLSFEPVLFTPGDSKLDQAGIDNLAKLAKLLTERPQVQLTLCGYPARSDILSMYKPVELGIKPEVKESPLSLSNIQQQALLSLFNERLSTMKKYMVNELKVSPGQVLLCSEPDEKNWVKGIDKPAAIKISI